MLFLDAQKESTISSRNLLHMKVQFMRGTAVKRVRMEDMFSPTHVLEDPLLREGIPGMNPDGSPDSDGERFLSFMNIDRALARRRSRFDIDKAQFDSIPMEPLNIEQAPSMLDYAVDNERLPTIRQRIIIERRHRNLKKSWGYDFKYADGYLSL